MEFNELKAIIESVSGLSEIFKGCPYEVLQQWDLREYQTGTVICRQGEKSDNLYIIVNGSADAYYMTEKGNKYSEAVIKEGQFIGEFEIFDQKPMICTVEALADLKALYIKREDFLKWMTLDQNICFYLAQYACQQFYLFSEKAGHDTLYPLKTRLCNYLLSSSRKASKDADGIKLRLNKEKLSDELAVSVRSVHRVLYELKKENTIENKFGYILIKDLDKLAQEAEI